MFCAGNPLRQVTEIQAVVAHVTEDSLCLVELALALVIQRQVVEVFHQPVVHRALAELVKGHVELPLPLEGKAEHAVRLRGLLIRFFLATLSHQEALGCQQQMPEQQQRSGTHQLHPDARPQHDPELRPQQQHQNTQRCPGSRSGTQPRQNQRQIKTHRYHRAQRGQATPVRRHIIVAIQNTRNDVRECFDGGRPR